MQVLVLVIRTHRCFLHHTLMYSFEQYFLFWMRICVSSVTFKYSAMITQLNNTLRSIAFCFHMFISSVAVSSNISAKNRVIYIFQDLLCLEIKRLAVSLTFILVQQHAVASEESCNLSSYTS